MLPGPRFRLVPRNASSRPTSPGFVEREEACDHGPNDGILRTKQDYELGVAPQRRGHNSRTRDARQLLESGPRCFIGGFVSYVLCAMRMWLWCVTLRCDCEFEMFHFTLVDPPVRYVDITIQRHIKRDPFP
jgi:hypothetical protein